VSILAAFSEHFVANHPDLSDCLTGLVMLMLFVVSPILIFVLLSERYNKGRYLFEKKEIGQDQRQHLYLLDTMRGRLYWVDGKAFYSRVHQRDWKEERASANSGAPTS